MPVIATKSGKRMGTVKDLLFDEKKRLMGALLTPKGLIRKAHYIPMEKILSVGEDALTVEDEEAISELDSTSHLFSVFNGEKHLKGKPVLTLNGHELGQVEDVYFLEEEGTLIGMELSDGFLSDVTDGRKFLPLSEKTKMGADAILVPQELEERIKE
ncbi:PRC-barrel domain-containing protein [Thermicanus aegyptius]|uniref:PRC-barrel domain-containing protein n=1 Tax=Thermicanus aegyptius TaxID=94009 RepID=UPI00146FA426|nr:PRC-barrel domain-containing protein [Thermicanus aegyptius]